MAPGLLPAERAALAEIARRHIGFGSLDRRSGDDRDFREVAVGHVAAALEAAYAAGRDASRAITSERAPDCTTSRAAAIAGVIAEAVMAGEADLGRERLPGTVMTRIAHLTRGEAPGDDLVEGLRTAGLMISARARASVRTPSGAALSAAEAALALAEDGLDGDENGDTAEAPVVLAFIRDTLRAGLAPLHAAERQAPYDAGPAA